MNSPANAPVTALLEARAGWDNAVVMPPRCDVCHLDLPGAGGPASVAQLPGHPPRRRWPITMGRRGAAHVTQRLRACFSDGRSAGERAAGRHTEAGRAEFAA